MEDPEKVSWKCNDDDDYADQRQSAMEQRMPSPGAVWMMGDVKYHESLD